MILRDGPLRQGHATRLAVARRRAARGRLRDAVLLDGRPSSSVRRCRGRHKAVVLDLPAVRPGLPLGCIIT
eukprot:9451361-Lingulodinium_polyedra.AAC.1